MTDDELRGLFEGLQREVRGEIGTLRTEMRGEMSEGFAAVRDEIGALRGEMNTRFTAVDDRFTAIDARFTAVDDRFAAVWNEFARLRAENTAAHLETRRLFEVTAEQLRHELQIVAEGVLDTRALEQRVARIEERIS